MGGKGRGKTGLECAHWQNYVVRPRVHAAHKFHPLPLTPLRQHPLFFFLLLGHKLAKYAHNVSSGWKPVAVGPYPLQGPAQDDNFKVAVDGEEGPSPSPGPGRSQPKTMRVKKLHPALFAKTIRVGFMRPYLGAVCQAVTYITRLSHITRSGLSLRPLRPQPL